MSRDAILKRTRANKPEPIPMPARFEDGIRYDDTRAQFLAALESVHASCHQYADAQAFVADFTKRFPDAAKVYSPLDALCTFSADAPADYDVLDVAVYPSRLGVAENGAVFVDFGSEPQRSQAVLAQHLCLIVRERDLVDNMHQAYQALDSDFPDYGVFISGPSKTADIEQCLVVGAHGACTLTVALIASD